MLTDESKEIVEALKKVKKIIDIECDDCGEISTCLGCMWNKLNDAMEPIFAKARELDATNTNESLF